MATYQPVISNAQRLEYLVGWSYHNQLGSLKTHAPHVLPTEDSYPKGVTEIREMEITRAGFQPEASHAASYLYRSHPGPSWIKDGVSAVPQKEIAPNQVTGTHTSARRLPLLPRKYRSMEPANQKDFYGSLNTLFTNPQIAVGVSTGNAPMPFFFRNADGDDLFFIHEGEGFFETELGVLGYEAGHFVWIPKGIAYRMVPTSQSQHILHMENYGTVFQKPPTGLTGDAAIYYHRNIEVPKACFVSAEGKFPVVVKAKGEYTKFIHSHHPMDVVGWDGTLFPFRLHIRDIHPIHSWRAHIPPSAYCVFCGIGFEICAFVPRPVETGERSLPVPFDHINIDRDEVIFYSKGVFFSKDSSAAGSLTFHPRGFSHGPHPTALKRTMEARDKKGAFLFEGYSIMVETNLELTPTTVADKLEESDYHNSWL